MAMGNFLGGVFQGGMHVWNQQQQDEKLRIEREKADRESYEFDKRKVVDAKMQDISNREAAETERAGRVEGFANSGAATDALVEQAINANMADVANNEPGQTQAVPITDEQKTQIRAAYNPKGFGGDLSKLATEGELAQVRNKAVDAASAGDGFDADTIRDAVTPENQAKIVKRNGGIKPDEVNQYRYTMERARAYEAAGDWKTAKELKKSADADAAGSFMQAVHSEDRVKAMQLYNLFPNGHNVADIQFNGDKIQITDESGGIRVIDKRTAIKSAMAMVDPSKAALMDDVEYKSNESMSKLIAKLESVERVSREALAGRLAGIEARGSGGRSGGTKKASGHGGGNDVSEGDIGREDYFKQFGVSGESGSPEARTQASTGYGFYQMMLKNDPSIGEHEAFRLSQNIAMGKAELLPNFDETTLSWRRGIKTETGNFHWVDSPGNKPEAIGVDPKMQLEREMKSPFAKEVMDDAKWANFEKAYATARQSGNKQQIAELGNVVLFGQRVRGNQKKPDASKPENNPPPSRPDRMTNIPGRIISSAIGGIKDEAALAASNAANDIRKRLNPSIVLGQELNTPIDSVIKR